MSDLPPPPPGPPPSGGGWQAPGGGWPPPAGPPTTPPPYGAPPPPPGYGYAGAPPPMPVPPPRKRPVWPYLLGALVLALVGLGVLGLAVGSESDEDEDDADADAELIIEAVPATGPTITSGVLSITLPQGWVGADTSAGVEGLGALVFPDDAEAAAQVESAFGFLPRAIMLVGVDTAAAQAGNFLNSINVLKDESVPSGMSMSEVLDAQTDGIESLSSGDVQDSQLIDLGGRQVGRVIFEPAPGATVASYIIQADNGDTYVVTATFADLDDEALALADSSALTFTVAG